MNIGKSKAIAFERREAEVVDISTPYRVRKVGRCEVLLGE